jgi:KipI family sensor histidine kinase inhibitor
VTGTAEKPIFLAAGDAALVVQFGEAIDSAINQRVNDLARALRSLALVGVVDLVPTFRSLMIHYDPLRTDQAQLIAAVEGNLHVQTASSERRRSWIIPSCYEGECAPDLEAVARQAGLSPAEVIAAHSGVDFDVYMMGFMPGFPYMASMPPALRVPRLTEPRVRVPVRSVSIAAEITVVYAIETPGGLSLIGRTPVPFFDLRRDPPVLLESGDQVRFEAISLAEYTALEADYAAHTKTLEFTWIDA